VDALAAYDGVALHWLVSVACSGIIMWPSSNRSHYVVARLSVHLLSHTDF